MIKAALCCLNFIPENSFTMGVSVFEYFDAYSFAGVGVFRFVCDAVVAFAEDFAQTVVCYHLNFTFLIYG